MMVDSLREPVAPAAKSELDDLRPAPDAHKLRILYVGQLDADFAWTCSQRMRALQRLGHETIPVNVRKPEYQTLWQRGLRRINWKLTGSQRIGAANRELVEQLRRGPADLIWIDKNLHVSAETLTFARTAQPRIRIAGYSPDDMLNPGNQSREFRETLPLYDVFFTTKSYNARELLELGCRKTVFVDNAYDPELHRPITLTDAERKHFGGPVGFIGWAEHDRAESIAKLSLAGVDVRVWGDDWEPFKQRNGGRFEIAGPGQHGLNYIKVLCSFDINLCFLRKINRDLQTTRSIEIPACGGFMLGERTDEHLRLFEEGREAAFFGSDEELIEKTRYYLARPDERRRIAAAGRARCVSGGYGNYERMRRMIAETLKTDPQAANPAQQPTT